eukprot:2256533-Alexandrium_andersonii.AAC.1
MGPEEVTASGLSPLRSTPCESARAASHALRRVPSVGRPETNTSWRRGQQRALATIGFHRARESLRVS